jgi:hypothetical protein
VRSVVGVMQVTVRHGKFGLPCECSTVFCFLRVPPTVSFYARNICLLRRIVDGHIDRISSVDGFVGERGATVGPVDAAGDRCNEERASLRSSPSPQTCWCVPHRLVCGCIAWQGELLLLLLLSGGRARLLGVGSPLGSGLRSRIVFWKRTSPGSHSHATQMRASRSI